MELYESSKILLYKTIDSIMKDGCIVTIRKIVNKLKYQQVVSLESDIDYQEEVFDEKIPNNGYFSLYQDNIAFSNEPVKVKTLAFYLPQFHTFPENDEWWGEGFTEWTNTRKSAPRYRGHYQPREPHENIGYYDLSDVQVIKKQAKLARQHGIYGFCIYYYWFSGKTLMEKPIDLLFTHPEIDINYCLCWANESWTRTWDGMKNNILIEQKYTYDDSINFIYDIKKYFNDKRYIKHNGKPVIVVYNPGDIPKVKMVFCKWKSVAREIGIGDISIWICRSFNNGIKELGVDDIVDKEIEFPPHNFGNLPISVENPNIKINDSYVFDYTRLVEYILKHRDQNVFNYKLCRTVMLGWDNSARRSKGFNSFDNFDIHKYYLWLRGNVDETIKKHDLNDRYIFINAWNEWAEGTYLEPDARYGYSYLNVTSLAISQKEYCLETVLEKKCDEARIAVQVHVFYLSLLDEVISYLNNICESYDCYITTDSVYKANHILAMMKQYCSANKVIVTVYENRGRDVAPFLLQLQERALKYEYICHIHTKRSLHGNIGEKWRTYLFSNLLGSRQGVRKIISFFDDSDNIGVIYPHAYKNLLECYEWGSNFEITQQLLEKLDINPELSGELDFPAGNMLWVRVDAVKQLFENNLKWSDFPEENGQMDGTLMHAIERAWNYIAMANGYTKLIVNISDIEDYT